MFNSGIDITFKTHTWTGYIAHDPGNKPFVLFVSPRDACLSLKDAHLKRQDSIENTKMWPGSKGYRLTNSGSAVMGFNTLGEAFTELRKFIN